MSNKSYTIFKWNKICLYMIYPKIPLLHVDTWISATFLENRTWEPTSSCDILEPLKHGASLKQFSLCFMFIWSSFFTLYFFGNLVYYDALVMNVCDVEMGRVQKKLRNFQAKLASSQIKFEVNITILIRRVQIYMQ